MLNKYPDWEAVIGLEIHAELNTASKMFSTAPNRFGDEPNMNITEVCTGQPGALPVLNKEAVRKAIVFGLAIDGKIEPFSQFDRKSYFYPDSPRNFQITQFYHPIITGGHVIAEVHGKEKRFDIHHAHLEDDAGMLKHFGNFAGVDYNRAGVPLIEIVSEPCIHTPNEATAYAMAIRAILEYTDVSDCNMQEGSLRFDVNVSVRKRGEKNLRTKVEVKNLNSFVFMEKAIDSEIERQIHLYNKGEKIEQATFRFNTETGQTELMRKKEHADDYRYFPEPDLLPVILTASYIEDQKQHLPELPLTRLKRYITDYGFSKDNAFFLSSNKKLSDYFEAALKIANHPKMLYNWICVEFLGRLKESGKEIFDTPITPAHIAELVEMIAQGTINGKIAKSVADEMVTSLGKFAKQIVVENPEFTPMTDTSQLEKIIDQILLQNPGSITDYLAGKERALAFLVGQVMKETGGKASPPLVNKIIKEKIK